MSVNGPRPGHSYVDEYRDWLKSNPDLGEPLEQHPYLDLQIEERTIVVHGFDKIKHVRITSSGGVDAKWVHRCPGHDGLEKVIFIDGICNDCGVERA